MSIINNGTSLNNTNDISPAYCICEAMRNKKGNIVNVLFHSVNPQFSHIISLNEGAIIGNTITTLFPDFFKEYPKWLPLIEHVFTHGAVSTEDYIFINQHWYVTTLIPLDENKFIVTLNDITNVKKLDSELQITESNLSKIFSAAQEGFLLFTQKGELISLNSRAAEMHDFTPDEMIASGPKGFIHIDSYKVFEQFLEEVTEKGYFFSNAIDIKKDGSFIDVSIKGISIQGDNESYCMAVINDVTELKKTKESVQIITEQLHDVLNNISDNFFTLNNDLIITYINSTALKHLKITRDDVIGKNIFDAFPVLKGSILEKKYKEALKKRTHFSFEAFFDKTWYDIRISPNPDGISVFFQIITKKKQNEREREELINQLKLAVEKEQSAYSEMEAAYEEMEAAYEEAEQSQKELEKLNIDLKEALEKAQEAERVKGDFLGVMSHELRTPLAGMMGFSQLLCQAEDIKGIYKQYADFINTSGKRLLDVLNDLLEMSSIEAGRINLGFVNIDVRELINDVFMLLQTRFLGKGIAFEVELKDVDTVYTDKTRLRQILFNIIGNAVKFTDEGSVTVKVRKETEFYVFEVEDTGIGIDDKDRENVFEMFKQSEHHLRRKYHGTGLGLAICKKLVQVLGGNIWLRSEKGKGSVFYFSLPVQKTFKTAEIESEKNTVRAAKNIRVLFAEDDDVNFQLIERIISSSEFDSKGFYNGYELVKYYNDNRKYDMILLDIHMPIMNGIEAMREIRKLNVDIPIIAITAFAMPADRKKYLELGFSDYIAKPIIPEEFKQTIFQNFKNN